MFFISSKEKCFSFISAYHLDHGKQCMEIKLSILRKKLLLLYLVVFSFVGSASALSVTVTADTGGSVTLDSLTGGYVTGTYNSGSRIFIKAMPNSGYSFDRWQTDFTTNSSHINTTITSNKNPVALFKTASTAIMSINNKCVSRVLTYNITQARALNGVLVPATKVQIYVLDGSTFTSPVQDTSGYLAQSPNQSFYYAFNADVVGAGTYLGSNSAFAGNTTYLSLGSATMTEDETYNCTQSSVSKYTVSFSSNLPNSVSSNLSGAGTYNVNSSVTLSASAVSSYRFNSFSGQCGGGLDGSGSGGYAILVPISTIKDVYTYTISNLTSNCSIVANYDYVPPTTNQKYTVTVRSPFDTGGTVTIDGVGTGAFVSNSFAGGSSVTVRANPSSGYSFGAWSLSSAGSNSVYTFIVTGNIDLSASFNLDSIVAGSGAGGSFAPTVSYTAYPSNSAGHWSSGIYNYTFPTTLGGGLLYNYNQDSFTLPRPIPNQGYVFKAWIGNVGTTTLNALNNNQQLTGAVFNGIATPTITAVFEFNGSVNTGNNPDSFDEVLSTSEFGYISSNISAVNVNSSGNFEISPYYIDSKCVSRVVSFKGRRVDYVTVFGLQVPFLKPRISSDYNYYYLYGLDGSDLSSALPDGSNIYTFKSDPSSWIVRVLASRYDLPTGSYTSDNNPAFSFSSNSFDIADVQEAKTVGYSCTSRDKTASSLTGLWLPPFYPSVLIGASGASYDVPASIIQGISYLTNTGDSFVNTPTSVSDNYGTSSSIVLGFNTDSTVDFGFSRIRCDDSQSLTRVSVGCAIYFGFYCCWFWCWWFFCPYCFLYCLSF